MYSLIIYQSLTNPYYRIVRVGDGAIMTTLTGALSITTSWATSFTALSKVTLIGGIPVTIPEGLPPGDYDILFYDAGSPADSDVAQFGRRLAWAGKLLMGLPVDV